MKTKCLFLLLWALSLPLVQAQVEHNYILTCANGGISYQNVQKKESAGTTAVKVVGAILEASAGSNTSTEQHPEYIDAIRTAIAGAVGSAKRIRLADGHFIDMKESGCDLYYDGSVSTINATRRIRTWEDDKKKTHQETEYKATLVGNMNLKNAQTDEVELTIPLNSSAYSDTWMSTVDNAMSYCIERMQDHILNRLNMAYPLHASIVEGSTVKKDKQKEVFIDLGTNFGATKGMTFAVFLVGNVAGHETKKDIGRLRIIEVQGEEISLCKVTKGGRDIKSALDDGETLLITSN